MKKMKGIVLKNLLIIIFLFSNKIFSEGLTNQSVITEEYVAKVIIDAKWGTNAGEFGKQFKNYDEEPYQPESLAVDSKGNIYILDVVNNRIQKFNNRGTYLLKIDIDSFKGVKSKYLTGVPKDPSKPRENITYFYEIIPCKVLGINIAIDSEDNLYYYCQKNLMKTNEEGIWVKNPEAKGEVWVFKNDKLVKKYETNVMERFEPAPDYEIEKQKIDKDKEKVIIKFKDGRRMEKEVKGKYIGKDRTSMLKQKKEIIVPIEGFNNKSTGYVFDLNGNLKSIIKGEHVWTGISVNGFWHGNTKDGNNYSLITDSSGIKVIKYERQPIRK
jgi:hypothetical protein